MATATATTSYTWSTTGRRFRDGRGRYVARTEVRGAVDAYLETYRAEARSLATQLVAGSISIEGFHSGMEGLIKESQTGAGAVAGGGWKQMKPADWATVGRKVRAQYKHLNHFAKELENGLALDGDVVRRAEMYATSATGTYEAVLRRGDLAAGLDLERRLLHSTVPCAGCVNHARPGPIVIAGVGWHPAGVLPGIGEQCECRSNCRCTFERRRSKAPKGEKVPSRPVVPVKPPPTPARPEPTIAGLREAIRGKQWRWKRREAVADYIKRLEAPEPSDVREHGMARPERLRRVHWSGIDWHYAAAGPESPVVGTLLNLAERTDDLPVSLTRHTRNVIFTGQTNKDDDRWKATTRGPEFTSNATGGDGDVVVYGGKEADVPLLTHEMGHNLARIRYGHTTPRYGSDYRKAMNSGEAHQSDYARHSPSEDFAESLKYHLNYPKIMREKMPQRYRVIDRLLKDESYGG